MSDMTRRYFLTAVPAASVAGVAVGAGALSMNRSADAAQSETMVAPQLGVPSYVTRKRAAVSDDRGGLVLKISGLTVTRIRPAANTARVYFLDMEAAKYSRHFPQLILDKAGILPSSSAPDAVTPTLALYHLSRECRIEGPAGPLALTMGPTGVPCRDADKAGLNSFLQPRQGLGWTYEAATDYELEGRSTAWLDINRGQFENEADVKIGDPNDAATLVSDGTRTQVAKRILYYGIPAAGRIRIRIGSDRAVDIDAERNQIVAGLAHIPLHEHGAATAPQPLVDFGVLGQLMKTPGKVAPLRVMADCKAGRHLMCVCCDPVVEIL